MRRGTIGATAVAAIVAALTGGALAQTTETYPDRPIKVVVPAAAGGVTDTPARVVTNRMRDNLGQTLVVENQGGAGGILASENVKRASPDGYTLLYVNAATHGLLPALKRSLSYDAIKDFVPIVMAVRAPLAIVVRSESPYKTLADLVRGAGGESKSLNYGSPGPGNTSHLIGLMLAQASKTPMQAVHYRGEAPMIQDLISGQVDFAASNIIRTHVEAGTLRVLATTGDKRWFAFPDAPTLKELGYTAEYYAWSGFVAPAGTLQAVVDRINRSANIALAEPEVIKALTANGFEIVGGKPEIFAKAMSAYINDVSEIGRKNNLEID
ncbi:tripartite-type tricarboxylate transporter receptor subunit TctC [Bradyrhizobium sp. AZCC 2262]|uniref:Bug family tripartite tricarboxylate transporter substrate binding protein n=1 Tax=Bradyrhizobium sp. AZCC 2262 TaxID=3117022 RepID=UPI002FEF6789